MRLVLLASILLAFTLPVAAQPVADSLTLDGALRQGRDTGPAAEVARLTYRAADASFQAYQAQFYPALSLTGSAPGLQRSISDVVQDDGSVRYVERRQTFSTARLRMEQVLPWTGGRVSVASGLARVDQFGAQEFSQWQSVPVSVGWEQPLFQFNRFRWEQRLEPLRFRIADRALDADLAEADAEVVRRFFDVYLAQISRDVARFNVAVNDTIYTLSQGRFEIGKIAENELLQSELALLNAQSAASSAEITLRERMQDLRLALGLPDTAAVAVVAPGAAPGVDVTPDEAVRRAVEHRADFLSLRARRLEAERDVAQARGERGFGATVTARYGLNQSATAFDAAYRDLLGEQQFGVSFQVPLYRWGQGDARVEAAETRRKRTQRETRQQRRALEQDVYFAAVRFEQQQSRLRIAAKADTVAARRFEVARNRYTVGNISITELFDAQREKDSARRAYAEALSDVWLSLYRLRRLTLYDFASQQPL
jgi:outer membrane protein TolC